MGKTTLHHPVSLPIIREGARQGGIRLGRIHQDRTSYDGDTAVYSVEILQVPIEFGGALPQQIQALLNGCYSTDIQVARVWYTKSHKIYAELYTTVNVLNANRPLEYWLKPLTENEFNTIMNEMEMDGDQLEHDWLLDYDVEPDGRVTRNS